MNYRPFRRDSSTRCRAFLLLRFFVLDALPEDGVVLLELDFVVRELFPVLAGPDDMPGTG